MKKNVKQQNDHNNPRQLAELKQPNTTEHHRTQPRTEKNETHSTTKDNVKQTTEHII